MQVRVRPVHYGTGFVAGRDGAPDDAATGADFDGALLAFAARQPELCPPDGTPPRLD